MKKRRTEKRSRFMMALAFALSLILCLGLLAGCGSTQQSSSEPDEDGLKHIDQLSIYFVPSREPSEIVTATEPLKDLLQDAMLDQGYDVGEIAMSVGTTYAAVGEALSAGTADIGLGLPGGTYILYDDGCQVVLTSTRNGLSKDYDDAKFLNDAATTENTDTQRANYRALFIAGPSEKGQALAAKVNAGEELTWEDLDSVSWSVMDSSSSAGYIYPALWLQENYGKGITDLSSVVQADSYASAFARLASGQIDVLLTYADARLDYETRWNEEFGREGSIWEETNVIAVTVPIYNDTICVSNTLDDDLVAAIQDAFIAIAQTDEGKEVIAIYSHNGYVKAQSSDYDNERAAQQLILELTAAN